MNFTSADVQKYSFLNNSIWRNDKAQTPTDLSTGQAGSDDWFESALPNADAVLQDFVYITYPSILTNTGFTSTRWFRNLRTDEQVHILAPCPSVTLPTPPILNPSVAQEYATFQCPSYLTSP